MEVSRRKLIATIGVVLIVTMGVSAWSSMTTFAPCRITMYADPATEISLGQFQESECTTPFASYDWDGIVSGEYYQCPVYVKNTGTVGLYITYLPTDLWFLDDEAHFVITCWVIEFGLPGELYPLDTPIQLPEKDPSVCNLGFYLPPGKVMKVDIVLYVDSVVVGETYTWEFTFWGSVRVECEEPLPGELILDKFNDINGNGIYDAGDVEIADWRIDVMDPYGVTTTYLTPTVLEITEFGTYTITEDLPVGWEQTVVEVDGVPQVLGPTVTVEINEGETHEVLYGNKLLPPPPARLIVKKFNDTNGDGVFDVGTDVWISGWEIDVTDPDMVTDTHLTMVDLEITNFGPYTITEDLPADWEQTAVIVNGVPMPEPLSPSVDVEINSGDEHTIIYGNKEVPPSPPPRIEITLGIMPVIQYVGSDITFSWTINSSPEAIPVKVELNLTNPDGDETSLYTGMTFPDDFTGSETWTATGPTGYWTVQVTYYYTHLGSDLTAKQIAEFVVLPT